MSYPNTINDFNAHLDGISYMGKVSEATLPQLQIKTEAHRGAGMEGEVAQDMGLNAMQVSLTFAEWVFPAYELFGTQQEIVLRPFSTVARPNVNDAWIFTTFGLISASEPGGLKSGEGSMLKVTQEVRRLKIEHQTEGVMVNIDLEKAIRIVGGVDQSKEIRKAMGL